VVAALSANISFPEMGWIPAFTGTYDPAQLELILRFLSPNTFAY
jgi:hypothetical protein